MQLPTLPPASSRGLPRTPFRTPIARATALAVITLLGLANRPAVAAAPWGTPLMQPGIAAASCAAPASLPLSNAWVFGVMDLRNPVASNYGPFGTSAPLWNPPGYHHPTWTVESLGNVYGIAIDADGDLYVAAHGLYSKTWMPYHHRYGNIGGGATNLSAAGTIYRIDNTTGVPTVFAVLPQQAMNLGGGFVSGPGIGNLVYDRDNDQFFATNLEDGKIYRLSSAGAVVQTFDPLGADSGAAGLPPTTELLWGIGIRAGAVYYAVWNIGNTASPGKIRRINLAPGGALVPSSDAEILVVPASPLVTPGVAQYVPVTDIEFSADGSRMFLGERTMLDVANSYNHASRVHIARLVGAAWSVTHTLETGNSWGRGEAYGGVALGYENGSPEQVVWMTSADTATTAGPHGIQGVRPADFPPASGPTIVTNAYRVPFDPSYTASNYATDYKGSGGDVEIMQEEACARIKVGRIECPDKPDGTFVVPLDITNLSGVTVTYGWLTPCPTNQLPPGAVTAQPLPSSVFVLPSPLTNNATGTIAIQLPASLSGLTVCFRLTLLDDSGEVCCTEKICVPLPDCDCARLLDSKIECEVRPDGSISYSLTLVIQNLTHLSPTPFPFYHATFLPPTGFSPANATPTPNPIPPGGTGTITATYVGFPGPLCFNLTLHDDTIDPCCSIPVCLELPPCDGGGEKPDTCTLEERVPCKPVAGSTVGVATVNYTVCNNSTVPRTYSWSAVGLPATPPCTKVIGPAQISPASGTLGPVPPGGCLTVPITIQCPEFKPDDCARVRICATSGPDAHSLCCDVVVYRPKAGEPTITPLPPAGGGITTLSVGGTASLAFEIVNPEDRALEVTVGLRDEFNLLTFAGSAGERGQGIFTTSFVLPPRGSQVVRTTVRRLDQGQNTPDFVRTLAWARTGKPGSEVLFYQLPDTTTSIRLQEPGTKPATAPSIQSFRVEPGSPARVVLSVTSVEGRRYRVERTPDLGRPWHPAPGSVLESPVDEDGTFVGTGSNLTCQVPCEEGETGMFFRVVELP